MFDAAEGSIFAVEPGQIGGKEDNGEELYISGWVLLFSPELIRGTDLEARMKEFISANFRRKTTPPRTS